jgi:hypothetical protein
MFRENGVPLTKGFDVHCLDQYSIDMSTADNSHLAFHRGAAPIFALLTAEQTRQPADLRGDAAIAARLTELAEKANEGELSAAEEAEYEAYIEANNLLAVLQAEARFRLTHRES